MHGVLWWVMQSPRAPPPLAALRPFGDVSSEITTEGRGVASTVAMRAQTYHVPSTSPVTENAKQFPQSPWFLTGVTAPSSAQLIYERRRRERRREQRRGEEGGEVRRRTFSCHVCGQPATSALLSFIQGEQQALRRLTWVGSEPFPKAGNRAQL